MPYRPLNGNPRPNGMMPGMRPFPGGTIHVNPNFRGYQQRPPFPMNPVTPFGMPMMGMQPWMMNGRGYSDVRPAFGHKQGKPSDLSNPMPRKPQTMNRNRPERDQPSQESRKNGASNGKRAYNHESLEERKKHHADNSSVDRKQQNNPKTDSAKSQGEGQANTKGVRVVVSNIASSVSRPQLIEMADSIKKGSIQSVVIDRRNNQAEMIFQTTDSAKMFRRKFHRSALAENHITINISG
ncbi:hypothetical protein K493DRAFT_78549 [Basidiobolus meristosporus CBS 931.73]|uniref:RRM domain-containing protein n=1 Tax=Basidiobolus meristosporus CBS 931.73 TaxID=1314790 RepID=A0A1Y1XRP3_9FUNG|nr:hypothetical protein K493DRAFT_78549 [Basidiobolus meristosporus CBS 931.73]|eukprot:ORX88439.1 hypothetical protein K493DRAFT_78549 [Basidiobolus meristosporus CBS 931.73]